MKFAHFSNNCRCCRPELSLREWSRNQAENVRRLYLHDRSSSWQQPAAAGSMSVVKCVLWIQYFIQSSWIAHMAVFTSRQCTNWFFIWWNGMEGLHISKYAVNDASTINDEPPALTNKISMAKNQKHMYWHVNLGPTYMLILWLCSYCASTWQRLAAAGRQHGRCGYPLT